MQDRRIGYMEALKEANLYDESLIKEVSHKDMQQTIRQAITSLISEEKKVDGLLLTSNTIAVNGLKELVRQKVRIPEDLQIVCFDKSDVFDVMPVTIPYIQQPIFSLAKMASRLLLEQINEAKTNQSSYRLPAELIY